MFFAPTIAQRELLRMDDWFVVQSLS